MTRFDSADARADTPRDDANGPEEITLTALTRVCTFAHSCPGSSLGLETIGECVEGYLSRVGGFGWGFVDRRELLHVVECGRATSCEAFVLCAARGHDAAYCATHPNASCDGDTLVDCSPGTFHTSVDCSASGLHCVGSSGAAACTSGESCAPGSASRCIGDRAAVCSPEIGMTAEIDCRVSQPGSACRTGPNGVTCVPTPVVPCDGATLPGVRCDGDTAVVCGDGFEQRLDCATVFDAQCRASDRTTASSACVRALPECTADSGEGCDGTVLRSCSTGRTTSVDCRGLGFTRCVQSPASNRHRVVCAP